MVYFLCRLYGKTLTFATYLSYTAVPLNNKDSYMIPIQHEDNSNMLIIEVSGKFTQDLFNQSVIPQIERILKDFSEVNIVVNFNDDLAGLTRLLLMKKLYQYISPYSEIHRLAIMSNNSLLKWQVGLFKLKSNKVIENFEPREIEKAKAWLAFG